MIKFLLKGLLRDRSRSFFPILTVTAGVMLTVFFHAYITGIMGDMIRSSANFSTGHVKVMSKAYSDERAQIPNDLALLGTSALISSLEEEFPEMNWTSRIKFGGLLDVPDEAGETKAQGPIMGMGVNLFGENSNDVERMGIAGAIKSGRMPSRAGEVLVSQEFADKLGVTPGDEATFIGSTMYGSITFYNFTIAGTIEFGIGAMDRGAMIADVTDVQTVLNMEDGAGEILGYFNNELYNPLTATKVMEQFNAKFNNPEDEFSPVMIRLSDQDGLGDYLGMAGYFAGILVMMFIVAMSLVLWNTGLIGGLRRYGEVGVRLAIGEDKGHVYKTMVLESTLVGVIGSAIGTCIGLAISYFVQVKGINFGAFTQNSAMMMPNMVYAKITATTYYIGLIPGMFATILGATLAGLGIFKRNTAQLFKELEV